jgi:hypothetical protein
MNTGVLEGKRDHSRELVIQWPVTEDRVKIGMADTRIHYFDEGFARLKIFLLSDLVLFDPDVSTGLVEKGPLGGGWDVVLLL